MTRAIFAPNQSRQKQSAIKRYRSSIRSLRLSKKTVLLNRRGTRKLGEKEAASLTKLELIQDRACMRWQRARERLKATIPTTIAGTRALASYTAEVARTSVFDEDDSHAVLANIATALASR